MDAGLLPIRGPRRSKQRLADGMTDGLREELARALASDALDLAAATDFLSWRVVTDDAAIAREATARGFAVVRDKGVGLNRAVSLGISSVIEQGANSVVVVPADLPLARPEDLRDIVDTLATSDLVVVPSGGDGGTNSLALSPPDVIAPRFGSGSLAAHADAAAEAGLRCSVLALERLALDLDTLDDIDAFLDTEDAKHTRAYGICSRWAARA